MANPIAALYEDQLAIKQLIYPHDLGSNKKGHWITFTISVPQNSAYSKSTTPNNIGSVTGAIKPNIAGSMNNSISQTVTNKNGFSSPDFSTLSTTIESLGQFVFNLFDKDKRWLYTVSPGSTKISCVIALYTPDTLSSSQHSSYTTANMTEALGTAGQIAGMGSIASDVINGKVSGVWEGIKSLGTEQAAKILSGKNEITNALLKAQGTALNPQMEVFFSHIDFRTFQFDFMFTPKSAKEAETVYQIIQAFKFHAAPEIGENTESGGGRFFTVPSVFEIQMYKDGQPNNFINKFALSALESVVVDYAPQGWVSHEDGSPVQTRLTLQFKEMEIMTKAKIKDGF